MPSTEGIHMIKRMSVLLFVLAAAFFARSEAEVPPVISRDWDGRGSVW